MPKRNTPEARAGRLAARATSGRPEGVLRELPIPPSHFETEPRAAIYEFRLRRVSS